MPQRQLELLSFDSECFARRSLVRVVITGRLQISFVLLCTASVTLPPEGIREEGSIDGMH